MYCNKEVYNSFVPPKAKKESSLGTSNASKEEKLSKKLSNFGNGKINLKIRQAISIGASDESDDHESVVLDGSDGLFKGLLNPIDESEELEGGCRESIPLLRGRWLSGLRGLDDVPLRQGEI